MRKTFFATLLAGGMLFAAMPAYAQGGCTPENLRTVTASYLQAQAEGFPLRMPLGTWANYNEQLEVAGMGSGVISKELKIDFSRSFYDDQTCQSFTEVIVTDPAHPYVLGAAIRSSGGQVGALDMIVTDKGDWLFNANKTLAYSKAENWGVIPEKDRDTRDTIIKAADAYLDYFNDKNVVVPWGSPCARLEGGIYTGKGKPGEVTKDDSCNVGVPSDTKLVNRRYIVDPSIGAVAVILQFGKNMLPDVHSFRVEKGKIRYIHTITVCAVDACGFKYDEDTLKRLSDN